MVTGVAPDQRTEHSDGGCSIPASRPSGSKSPAEILAGAQAVRFVIQDFCPLAESIEWELGQRYWQERGNKAFISDTVPVPFVINNDGNLSWNAAEVFFASLTAAERSESLEPQIFVLELGIGVGLFARFFLDRFRELCVQNGKDYYDRLCYVAADRSERMLLDACRHGVFANHPGHYLLRVVDALCPERDLPMDVAFGHQCSKPFRAVFLNYLLDCLPAAALQIEGNKLKQLCVRTCVARGAPLSEYAEATVEELARQAASPDPNARRDLMKVVGLLASEYDYHPVDAAQVPYSSFALQFAASSGSNSLLHNYGAIQCLERLLELVDDHGFILVNDYGCANVTPSEEFEHQRFSHATGVGINFPLLKGYFGDSGKCSWVEPAEDNGHIYSRLLGRHLTPEATERFRERFGKAAYDWFYEPAKAARNYVQQGRYEAAAAAYRKALERQPHNWLLMREVALFLAMSLRNPSAGLEMAKSALALNPTCSADLWNALGDCLFVLERMEDSRQAFLRALRVNPSDVGARYNLAWVLAREKNYAAALHMIAEGLALDKTGEYRDRLLQKQSEVLGLLAQRNQQEYHFMVNRIIYSAQQHGDLDRVAADQLLGAQKQNL